MSDISLYRKYRPQTFGHLIGQEHVRTTLTNAFKEKQIAHAYLFCGPRGTGKTTSARLVAKAINCTALTDDGEPCDSCDMCNSISDGSLIDLIEIDAASNRGIDEIRDLKEKISFSPNRARAKVYIIDEVHMLTKEAFNALLKTLEEPPSHSYFILATTEVHKIPETIISRCQRFDFKRVDEARIIERLQYIADQESIKAEPEALNLIASQVSGGMRDAIGLFEQISAQGELTYKNAQEILGVRGNASLDALYTCIIEGSSADALKEIDQLYQEGCNMTMFSKDLLWHVRGKMVKAVESGSRSEAVKALKVIELFQKTFDTFRNSPIPQLPLEAAILKACGLTETVSVAPVAAPVAVASVPQAAPTPPPPVEVAPPVTMEVAPPPAPLETMAAPATQPTEVAPPRPTSTPASPSDLSKAMASIQATEPVKRPEGIKEKPVSAKLEPLSCTFEELKKMWPQIVKSISAPTVMHSVRSAKLLSLNNGEVALEFNTKFHFERMNNNENVAVVEEAFKKVFNQGVKITTSFKAAPRQTQDEPEPGEELRPSFGDSPEELARKAAAMFGGEVVE